MNSLNNQSQYRWRESKRADISVRSRRWERLKERPVFTASGHNSLPHPNLVAMTCHLRYSFHAIAFVSEHGFQCLVVIHRVSSAHKQPPCSWTVWNPLLTLAGTKSKYQGFTVPNWRRVPGAEAGLCYLLTSPSHICQGCSIGKISAWKRLTVHCAMCYHTGTSSPLIPRPYIGVTAALWCCCPAPLRPALTLGSILVGCWKKTGAGQAYKKWGMCLLLKEPVTSAYSPSEVGILWSPQLSMYNPGPYLNWIEIGRAHTVMIPICRWWNQDQ